MKKFHLEFNASAVEKLERLARENQESKTDIVRHALNIYSYLKEAMSNGEKVYIEAQDGEKTLVVFP